MKDEAITEISKTKLMKRSSMNWFAPQAS